MANTLLQRLLNRQQGCFIVVIPNLGSVFFGEIMEIEILPTTKFADQKISELPIPEGVVLGGIVRDNKLIFPDENTTIFVKDKLILFSDPKSIKEIEKFSEVNIEFF